MKTCLACAEPIKDEAVICKHCGFDVRAPLPAPPSDLAPETVVVRLKRWKKQIILLLLVGFLVFALYDAYVLGPHSVSEATCGRDNRLNRATGSLLEDCNNDGSITTEDFED
jgi:hypothetical protein